MSDYVIETNGLTRYFGSRCVVEPMDLKVPRGSIFAFLGRNGSGKSTTIRMLLGLLPPTRGGATILGYDCTNIPPEGRGRIGYLAEGHHVYEWMRVAEAGRFQSQFFPTWNESVFRGVVDHFGLRDSAHVKELSRGERAGLCLALTLAPEPELLILDDPAIGLDPVARRSLVQSMIYVTRREDHTIFFSSHMLSDVERVADHVGILDRSILRACCSIETFRQRVKQYVLEFAGAVPQTREFRGLLHVGRLENTLRLTIANPSAETDKELADLAPLRIEEAPLSLEEAFLDYLGEHEERSFFAADVSDESGISHGGMSV